MISKAKKELNKVNEIMNSFNNKNYKTNNNFDNEYSYIEEMKNKLDYERNRSIKIINL